MMKTYITLFFLVIISCGEPSFAQSNEHLEGFLISVSDYEAFEILVPYIEDFKDIPNGFPLKGTLDFIITSGFNTRYHPIEKKYKFHKGIDIAANIGTLVVSTADGVIERVKFSEGGYGRSIIVNHNYGFKTLYGHLAIILVEERQHVKKGDIIGMVGSTGKSTGNHLHYEIRKNENHLDPGPFISNFTK